MVVRAQSLPRRRVAVLAAVTAAFGIGAGDRASLAAASAPCRPHVSEGVLPKWARTGFSEKRPRVPHVVGRSRRIAAILWGRPLTSPPSPDHSNKILWVSRRPVRTGSDLRITAQRMQGRRALGRPVRRRVAGGPGPSIVDLPRRGCWRLSLRWSGRVDRVDLRYVKPD